MIESLEDLAFKRETVAFFLTVVNQFFEGKKIPMYARIPHQIDGPKAAFAEYIFHLIAIAYN